MKKLNKHGMMDDMFDFLFTVIAAFFILLFVGMALSGGQKERDDTVLEMTMNTEANEILLNYLRTPLEDGNMADLIALRFHYKDEYDSLYKQETERLLDPLQTNKRKVAIQLYDLDNYILPDSCVGSLEICEKVTSRLEHLEEKRQYLALATIPTMNGELLKAGLVLLVKK